MACINHRIRIRFQMESVNPGSDANRYYEKYGKEYHTKAQVGVRGLRVGVCSRVYGVPFLELMGA